MSHCRECGHELGPHVKFCTACGTRVERDASASVTDAAASQGRTAIVAVDRATPEPALTSEPVTGSVEESAPQQSSSFRPHDRATDAPASRYPTPGTASRQPFDAGALASGAHRWADQARTHAGATLQNVPLPPEQMKKAARDGLVLLGGALLTFTVLLGLADLLVEGINAPMLWLRGSVALLALAMRGAVSVDGTIPESPSWLGWLLGVAWESQEVNLSAALLPLTLTAGVVLAAALLARRTGRLDASLDGRSRALRALITGATFGLALALCTALLGYEQLEIRVAADPLKAFTGGLVLVGLGTFVGLGAGAVATARLPRPWAMDIRTARDYTVAVLTIAAVVIVGVVVYRSTTDGGWTPPRFVTSALDEYSAPLLVPAAALLPNLLVLVGAGTSGVGFTSAATGSGELEVDQLRYLNWGWGMLEGGAPGGVLLGALALCLLAAVVVGVRATTRHTQGAAVRWWQPALLSAGLWLALAWATTIRAHLEYRTVAEADGSAGLFSGLASSEDGGSVTVVIGLSLLGSAAAAALWTTLATVAGHRLAPLLGATAPRALAILGGRHMDPTWHVAVADAVLRRGQHPPAHLRTVADALREGSIPPPTTPL